MIAKLPTCLVLIIVYVLPVAHLVLMVEVMAVASVTMMRRVRPLRRWTRDRRPSAKVRNHQPVNAVGINIHHLCYLDGSQREGKANDLDFTKHPGQHSPALVFKAPNPIMLPKLLIQHRVLPAASLPLVQLLSPIAWIAHGPTVISGYPPELLLSLLVRPARVVAGAEEGTPVVGHFAERAAADVSVVGVAGHFGDAWWKSGLMLSCLDDGRVYDIRW